MPRIFKHKHSVLLIILLALVIKLSPGLAMSHSTMGAFSQANGLQNSDDSHCEMNNMATSMLSSPAHAVSKHAGENTSTATPCCLDDCQCPSGACASVYAVMQTSANIADLPGNESPVIALSGHYNLLPTLQYRPPKIAHAG